MDYQFIIISATEARKEKTLQLLHKVNDKNKPIHILEASVPENSQDYIVGYEHLTQEQKGQLCCCRSHMRAIEYASLDSSPDYSVILEDDTTFVKSGFSDMIEELLTIWNDERNNVHHISIIHIGWIPTVNYKVFSENNHFFQPNINLSLSYTLLRFAISGLQGYIVCKKNIRNRLNVICSPTYSSWRNNVLSLREVSDEHRKNIESMEFIPVDWVIHIILFCPAVLFPPIVIERFNEQSLLGHKNTERFWKPFFKDYESEIDKYLLE